MGDVVQEAFPEIADQVFDQAERATGVGLRSVSQDRAGDLQAAVYTVSVITHLGLLESGWQPDVLAGHQLGSYAALAAAGCLSFTDGLLLVREHAFVLGNSDATGQRPEPLVARLENTEFREPYLPVVGSGSSQLLRTGAQARQDLLTQVDGSDRWRDTMSQLVGRGRDVVIEVGPGRRLSAQFAQAHPQVVTRSTADIRRIRRLTREPARI
ncbi:ACP S-malonyltransferase [Kocuria sp. ZOR0020]|uniref:ACP S-malonyltransferase n=1 Tax=Kocuria sp. ZOR0020 TaxID=1339234 RepID=UPI00068BADAA|nr:hypothetical protein [Kocuria sp. ZOR0020]